MNTLYFDTGPIISLAMNNLLGILKPLKERANARFVITDHVKKEIIDKPLSSKKFKFEALQILKLVRDGVLEILPSEYEHETEQLLEIANKCIKAKGKAVRLVSRAEVEILVTAHKQDSPIAVIDERTIRLLLENPQSLEHLMKRRLHTRATLVEENVKLFRKHLRKLKIIRSVELVSVAYKLGLLDQYQSKEHGKEQLLDALLWGVKLNGAAVSEREITAVKKMLR